MATYTFFPIPHSHPSHHLTVYNVCNQKGIVKLTENQSRIFWSIWRTIIG